MTRFVRHYPFFNRVAELSALSSLTNSTGKLVLVTGPRDSGKSAVMREFATRMVASHTGTPILIDMRDGTFNTAGSFARHLRSQVLPFIDEARKMIEPELTAAGQDEPTIESAKLFLAFAKGIEKQPGDDMSQLLTGLQGLFSHWRVTANSLLKGGERAGIPTLIIDEANRLHEWSRDEMIHLKSLEAFFIKLTKQERIGNVVLCSSENFFRSWMQNRLGGEDRVSVGVIGDLVETEARAFFLSALEHKSGCKRELPGELWEKIYDYLGGRMFLLEQAVDAILNAGSNDGLWELWNSFQKEMEKKSVYAVRAGFSPESIADKWTGKPCCWSREGYTAVLRRLLESESGIVSVANFVRDGIPVTELRSLIMHNLFHYCEESDWGKDVPGFEGEWPAIMCVSRPQYHAISRALDAGPVPWL